ncbi:nitrous oxide reductase accessory protein NosL [Sulfurospirillum sp. 1612]|uniref:nitrous oxide reductase accessory protein NosL n=1 Tax=Sulfurospirillum sp. 1612 TaxID=3094835 RepID=UPI002F93AEA9
MKKIILILAVLSMSMFASQIKLLDQNASDIVYKLPLKKYPQLLCEATLENGDTLQFVSVKAMMQVFLHQDYFKKHHLLKSSIKEMFVQDYLTKEKINIKNAVFVFGSKIIGAHGDDLIPLKNQANAKLFEMKYGGTKILPYQKITVGLIRYLDM